MPFSDGGRSWHTVFDDEFNLIEVRAECVWQMGLGICIVLLEAKRQRGLACRMPPVFLALLGTPTPNDLPQWHRPSSLTTAGSLPSLPLPLLFMPRLQGRPGEWRRVDSLLQTVAALRQLLANLQHACGWQPTKVSLLGFSQVGLIGWVQRV